MVVPSSTVLVCEAPRNCIPVVCLGALQFLQVTMDKASALRVHEP